MMAKPKTKHQTGFNLYIESTIEQMKNAGRIRTAETYQSSLNSFRKFLSNRNVKFDEINSSLIISYESYLRNKGVTPNSSSFYMRTLRAVYNRAVEDNLTEQQYPFKHVYTGIDKTIKRAVPLWTIKRLKEMDLSQYPKQELARDMFLFSFYTRGMSTIDMAYLKTSNLRNGMLTYRRRKTGQLLCIKWERCMEEIVAKYNPQPGGYLLPLINPSSPLSSRQQYLYSAHNINRSLKIIGAGLGLSLPLTMYVARHSWASAAKSKNMPISVISEGMGHDSEQSMQIYLASLVTTVVDRVNAQILKDL